MRLTSIVFRSLIVSVGYIVSAAVFGMVISMMGVALPEVENVNSVLLWNFIASLFIGLSLGPIVGLISTTRLRHFIIWTSTILFNLVAVVIEGAFFLPQLTPFLSVLVMQQIFTSIVAGLLITWLFAKPFQIPGPINFTNRKWYSWLWRYITSAFSYLMFYLVFGAVNYQLVTKPYYETHSGGLAIPAPELVLKAELIRAPLIILSLVPLLLSTKTSKKRLILICGFILFAIGGIVPLIQASTLPLYLRIASGWEIFFQNFLTGTVSAILLGNWDEKVNQ